MVDPYAISPTMAPPATASEAPQTMLTEAEQEPDTAADRFFPSMKADEPQDEQAKPAAQPGGNGQPDPGGADGIRVVLPEEILELRENDRARRMFSPQKTYEFDLPDDLLELQEESPDDLPAEVKAAALAELREMAADMSMSSADVRMLVDRARATVSAPVQDEAAQRDQASRQLAFELGSVQAAKQALAEAKQLLARDPRMRMLVLSLGMGNDVQTIKTLAELARRERSKGRLK